jgi:hypothetical protein
MDFLWTRPQLAVGSFREIRVKRARKIASFTGIDLFSTGMSQGGWFIMKNTLIYGITYFHGAVQWLDYIEQKPR